MPRASLTPKILDKARQLVARGHSIVEAATKLGVGKSQLYEHLKAPGRSSAPAGASTERRRPTHLRAVSGAAGAQDEPTPVGTPDDLRILNNELEAAQAARIAATADGRNVKPLIEAITTLVKTRRLMAPPVVPTLDELEARSRPKADEVLAKVRSGMAAIARGEAKTGCCARCGTLLTPELIELRRAQAGIVDEPVAGIPVPESIPEPVAAPEAPA